MFKIGEFSTIARVSDVLLRHYDRIDLFKPAWVDPTSGYRYYTIEQLPELNRILALRDLGLSLEQIGRMVADDVSAEEIRGMLALRKAQIEQALAEERARLRRVASRLKQIEQRGAQPRYDVVEKSLAEQPYLAIREPVPHLRTAGWLYYQIIEAVQQTRVPGLGPCMALFHDPVFRVEHADFELGFLLDEFSDIELPLPEGRVLAPRVLAPVKRALTCVHIGPWPEIHLGFAAIGGWIESHDLQIAGEPRELYHNLVPPEQDDELIVEIQIPVTSSRP